MDPKLNGQNNRLCKYQKIQKQHIFVIYRLPQLGDKGHPVRL